MKPYLLIFFVLAAMAGRAQQIPSQIQAKKGVFTERLFLNGQWVDRISTYLSSTDDSSNSVLTTGKAVTDFVRLHSLQHASVTADGNYIHNWNHKALHIDSINRLQFESFETDSNLADNEKVHNTIQMYPGGGYDSAINLISVLRNVNNSGDSITSQLRVSPIGTTLSYQDDKILLSEGPFEGSIGLSAYNYAAGDYFSEISVAPEAVVLNNPRGNFYIHGLNATTDTGAYKPIVYNASTEKIAWLHSWPGGGIIAKDTNYVPVLTPISNVSDAAITISGASRIGNTVHVSGYVSVTAIKSGVMTYLEISVPWPSTDAWDPGLATGTGVNAYYKEFAQITAGDTNTVLFQFISASTGSVNFSFSFQYQTVHH